LLYVPSNISGQMAVVDVATKSGVTFGPPRLFRAAVTGSRTSGDPRAWDLAPDGHLVGVTDAVDSDRTGPESANELRIVVNWLDELKQRVSTR
jgi:hypothetical protein